MQFLRAVSHSIVPAQPLQIRDHNSDESDNDVADNADTDHATPSPADGVDSVAASADTSNSCVVKIFWSPK